jgi:hypothetical protein
MMLLYFELWVYDMHLEIWQIILICILLIPVFFLANYIIVRKAAAEKRSRDERIERAVAESVARSFSEKGAARFGSWPKYNARKRR